MTGASYDELLRADGYRPGLPARHAATIRAEDSALCRQSHCAACGHAGLDYAPYTTSDRRRYRALAVCPLCGEAAEF